MLRWSSVHRRSSYWEPSQLQLRYAETTGVSGDGGNNDDDDESNDHQRAPQLLSAHRAMTVHGDYGNASERRRHYRGSAPQRARSVMEEGRRRQESGGEGAGGGGGGEAEGRKNRAGGDHLGRKFSLASGPMQDNAAMSPQSPTNGPWAARGSFGTIPGTPLLAIDDGGTTTEEEDQSAATGDGARKELLPALSKSHSKASNLRRASFCDEVIQKDTQQTENHRQQNGGGGSMLLGVPTADGQSTERRFSLQSAAALIRRRSSFAREKWASKLEFLLAVIGYAVDLGNIWRFPSVCYKHGGGAFLIPYVVMLLIGGLPMFYMELVLGQFHRSGCLSIWKKICPMFKGIGYGICFICTFISCFYNTVIAHAVYFFISSLAWEVPWQRCNNTWNTAQCRESLNASMEPTGDGQPLRTPSQEFYLLSVLESEKSNGLDDLGGIKPSMAFCLLLVFLIVYFALWKGPRSTGKIVWVTATAPYLVLTILLIRGLTLPGASKGIYYYLMPNFDKLLEPTVWTAAATQIFFSLGPGFGVLLALSSYNDFNNNCYRDAVVTSLINCFTSFFSGFVIFSTLGYMSELTNRPVSEVVGEGESSLIFVVYPQAISTMNYSPIWSLIFFLMLITLGIDSTFSGIEAFITGFCDEYPRLLARRREIFVAFVIAAHYIGSLPATTYGGSYVIPFLDEYGVSLSVLFIVMCEMIAVCWFYGIRRFSEDIRLMLGFYPGLYWRCCWTLCPVFIGCIFLLALYSTSFSPMQIPHYTYPDWSVKLGWLFRLLSCLSVPGYVLYMFLSTPGTIMQRFKVMLTAQPRSLTSAGASSVTIGAGVGGAIGGGAHSQQLMVAMGSRRNSAQHQQTQSLLLKGPRLAKPDQAHSNRLSIGTLASNYSRSRQSSFASSSIAHL